MTILIASLIVLALFLLVLAIVRASDQSGAQKKLVRQRVRALAEALPGEEAIDLVRRSSMSDVPWLDRILNRMGWSRKLANLIEQGRAPGVPGVYVLISALLGVAAFSIIRAFTGMMIAGLGGGLFLSAIPFMWLNRRKMKRMEAFGQQLPDALELIARSLKAGHTFSGGMAMAAEEFGDPIGPEFQNVLDEINFGLDADHALANLLERVDCPDLKFFVVSVNIQRETGGNLAEIVDNIATLIRERFKLVGRVRVLSAEGRLSAMILIALPFVIALVINFLNPDYMQTLIDEPQGKYMIMGALGLMTVGTLIIRRMIKIKV